MLRMFKILRLSDNLVLSPKQDIHTTPSDAREYGRRKKRCKSQNTGRAGVNTIFREHVLTTTTLVCTRDAQYCACQ